ncbi:PHP domain-containing protein [Gaiella occulta]|uniref:DNA-directed DNA polymerase n=1 Tax=Gaiella occulta TaxID=1002870 RepID=A0A7M2YWU9_9ACTN|nr:DNA polymerase/3'-5' exonuclease PolX [Gaiella occulta]RDI74059.1 PHP domain-containing protein [Gaiella occulta]
MAAALPRNGDLADQLELLADLSEILGEQPFRVLAYRRAAARIRDTAASVAELALAGTARELPGIGKTIEAKIVEAVESGEMQALSRRRAQVPGEVASFMRLPGLGPKTAARIWRELGVTTLAGLREAAERQRLRALPGFGQKSEEKILRALAEGAAAGEPRRGLLGSGLPLLREVVEALRAHPAAVEVSEAGSVRRRKETFRDLDVIATAADPAALTAHFVALPWVLEVVAHGDSKATVITKQGLRLDLRVAAPESYGDLLQHFTGSKEHNVALREEAQRGGLSVSEYGVTVSETGEVRTFRDEESLYAFLGYAFIPPELRESAGELEAARTGTLPHLVELADLKGDMHCHSSWSADGRASIEEMARAAAARGYRFLCLTDHSHSLRDGRIEAQWEEIAAVNERVAPFRVLRGVEANITAKGDVDLADEVLEQLDWVVASLHTSFDRSPTERILAAIESPHVDCIGHLSGRRLSRRRGADVDVERIVARAAETRTALEINAQPERLDMRDVHARLAGEAGVLVPVDSDAHTTQALAYAELGIGQARRAWLTKDQVLNTRTWAQIAKMRG